MNIIGQVAHAKEFNVLYSNPSRVYKASQDDALRVQESNSVHPAVAKSMAWFAPSIESINDDDNYIAEYRGKGQWRAITNLGGSSCLADAAKNNGVHVRVGQALLKGMTLKGLI